MDRWMKEEGGMMNEWGRDQGPMDQGTKEEWGMEGQRVRDTEEINFLFTIN